MRRELIQKRDKTLSAAFKSHMSPLDTILQTILGMGLYDLLSWKKKQDSENILAEAKWQP